MVVVYVGLLAVSGFFHAEELGTLRGLRRVWGGRTPVVTAPDTTELAGEIVSTDLPQAGETVVAKPQE